MAAGAATGGGWRAATLPVAVAVTLAVAAAVTLAVAAAVTLRAGVISRVAAGRLRPAAASAEAAVLTMPGWAIMQAVASYSHGYGGGFHGPAYTGYRGGYGATYGHSGAYYGHGVITVGMVTLPALTGVADIGTAVSGRGATTA